VPSFLGVRAFDDYPLAELVPYIDWMPFFNAWEFAGKFPDILTDPIIGESASSLYADARRMLHQLVEERWIKARAVVGFFPANSVADDDITIYADEERATWRIACTACGNRKPRARINRSYAWRTSWRPR